MTVARILVKERLAACVQLSPAVTSLYRWNKQIRATREVVMSIKTGSLRRQALLRRLRELHPYQVPEILVVPVKAGLKEYSSWILAETRT